MWRTIHCLRIEGYFLSNCMVFGQGTIGKLSESFLRMCGEQYTVYVEGYFLSNCIVFDQGAIGKLSGSFLRMCCENMSMVYIVFNVVTMYLAHQFTVMKDSKFELSCICNISTVHIHRLFLSINVVCCVGKIEIHIAI